MGQMGFFDIAKRYAGAGRQERSAGEDRRGGSVGRLPAASGGDVALVARGEEVEGGHGYENHVNVDRRHKLVRLAAAAPT